MNRPRHIRRYIVAVVAIAVLAAALNPWTLSFAPRWLDVGRPRQKADAVVLLNGGYDTRPFVAAALVHGGWAPKVIFCTVAPHAAQTAGAVPPSSEIVLKVLRYGGVSGESQVTLLDAKATTTFDEAKAVAGYLAEHPARRLLIVTEGPHTRRAEWIFRQVLADRPVEIVMISAPTEGFDPAAWWRSEAGFLFVVSEYFKLFYYALRYGWLGYELLTALVAIVLLRAWFRRRRKPDCMGKAQAGPA